MRFPVFRSRFPSGRSWRLTAERPETAIITFAFRFPLTRVSKDFGSPARNLSGAGRQAGAGTELWLHWLSTVLDGAMTREFWQNCSQMRQGWGIGYDGTLHLHDYIMATAW